MVKRIFLNNKLIVRAGCFFSFFSRVYSVFDLLSFGLVLKAMNKAASIILVVATTYSLLLQTASVNTGSVCASNYEELRSALVGNPGNRQRLLYTFLPPDAATPDLVTVYYHINGTENSTSFENNLGCNFYQPSDPSLPAFDYQYIWSNTDFLLQMKFDTFQWGTLWVAALRKTCIELVIIPFCVEVTESTEAKLLLTLTSWLRSYALDDKETLEGRDYAMEIKINGTASDFSSALQGAFTLVSSTSSLWTWWILLRVLRKSSNKFTKPCLGIFTVISMFLLIFDITKLAMSSDINSYFRGLYENVFIMFFVVYILVFSVFTLLQLYRIAKGRFSFHYCCFLIIFWLIFTVASILLTPLCFHLFWLCIALILYPVRVGSILLVSIFILAALCIYTYTIIKICVSKPRISTPNLQSSSNFQSTDNVDTKCNTSTGVSEISPLLSNPHSTNVKSSNSDTIIIPIFKFANDYEMKAKFERFLLLYSLVGTLIFLICYFIVYIDAVVTVNVHTTDTLKTLGAALIPSTTTGIILWILRERIKI